MTEVDPAQAATLLHATEAQIPTFEAQIDEQASTLSALLGVPPRRVEEIVGDAPGPIPNPPAGVAMGLPADLLRRRPDVRRSERLLAAQSAQIGIAKADLLPHLSLVGSINLDAKDADKFFEGRSFEAFGGPSFSWAILNYGRITNNVRVQDAEYQALVNDYTNTVVLAQQFLVQQQDLLAASEGQTALTMVTVYKSLGGGWEPWEGRSVVSAETAAQMSSRTRWGDLLAEHEQQSIAQAASTGTEHDRGWWRWRWWRPQW